MHSNGTRETPAISKDLLGAAGCLSIAGPISAAVTASANPMQAVTARSHCALASTAQTGTNIRGLTIHANGIRQYYLEAGTGPPVGFDLRRQRTLVVADGGYMRCL